MRKRTSYRTVKERFSRLLGTKLHWVDGPWPGKLAIAARPRGGEWLEDEIAHWRRSGANVIFSLLTGEEERDLDISNEEADARASGMSFLSFPIPDRQVPASEPGFAHALDQLNRELALGRNVVLHCRQGIGRTGLVAACLLLTKGMDPEAAIGRLSEARGVAVPETPEQCRWIHHFAESLTASR